MKPNHRATAKAPSHKAVERTANHSAMAIYHEVFGGLDLSLSESVRRKARIDLRKQFKFEFAAFILFQVDQRLKSAGLQEERGARMK